MKSFRHSLAGLTAVLLLTARAQAQAPADSLDLATVLDLALIHNPGFAVTEEGVAAAQARVEQARAAQMVNVGADLSYLRLDPVSTFNVGGHAMKVAPNNTYKAELSARYPLWDAGRAKAEIRLGERRRDAAAQGADRLRALLAGQAALAFDNLLLADRAIATQQEQIAALEEHVEVAGLKARAGSATDYDVLATQARVSAARGRLVELRTARGRQEVALRRLLGRQDEAPLLLKGRLSADTLEGSSRLPLDSLEARAYRQRPERAALELELRSLEAARAVTALADKPSVDASLGLGVKNGYAPEIDEKRPGWALGLSAHWPIYRGKVTERRLDEADATLRGARARLRDVEEQISAELRQALEDCRGARQRLALVEEQARQSAAALEQAKRLYAAGAGRNLDVLDAEAALSEAELQRQRAAHAWTTACLGLDLALGERIWERAR